MIGEPDQIVANIRELSATQALACDVRTNLFGDGTTTLKNDVVDAFWWLYRNHEAIQRSGRRAWLPADRAEFPPG